MTDTKFWDIDDGKIKPLNRVMYNGVYWDFYGHSWEHEIEYNEKSLKREGYFVLFVPYREHPNAYLVYYRREKGYTKGSLDMETRRGDPYGHWRLQSKKNRKKSRGRK